MNTDEVSGVQVAYNPSDEQTLNDPSFWTLATPAQALATELRGDHLYSGSSLGYPTKPARGHCRLCGQSKKLTFEHIPPKSTGNRTTHRFASAFDILESEVVTQFPTTGIVIQQRGSGFFVLCGDCNERLSKLRYVAEYRMLVGATAQVLVDLVGQKSEEDVLPGTVYLGIPDLRPGRIARQALAMLLCASGSANLGTLFPKIRDCVLDGTPLELPMGMSLHLAVTVGPRGRLIPPVAAIDHAAGSWEVLVEATFAPLSWILRISNSAPNMPAANVSEWTTLNLDTVQDIEVTTEAGFVYGPMPLDYRHASEFPATAEGRSF